MRLLLDKNIGNNHCALILGDNLLCGGSLSDILVCANLDLDTGAHIFGIEVENPREFGVIEFDSYNRIINLEEKPLNPKSNFAIPGIYFYENQVIDIAKNLTPSNRGELEITGSGARGAPGSARRRRQRRE